MAKQRGARKPRTTVSDLLAEASSLLTRGDIRGATQCLQQALAGEPNNVDVRSALGELHLKSGETPQAEANFEAALRLQPDFVQAAVGLVKAKLAMGRLEDAEATCRTYLLRHTNDLLLGQLLAQVLIDQDRKLEAIEWMRLLVSYHPRDISTLNSLAKRLSEVGDFDASREFFRQALEVNPGNGFAYLGWVQTKTVTIEDGEILASMEAASSLQMVSESDRMQVLFALGKAYGDLKRFEESMTAYREGNEIRDRASQVQSPFQLPLYRRYFDLTRELFTRKTMADRQSQYDPAPTPIFIIGMFRSGTTLVEQILSSHSAVAAGGEIAYWLDQSAPCFDLERRSFDFERAKVMRVPYQQKLRAVSKTARFVTDKMPGNYRILGLLRILYPGAKFIHCARHPVDTCLSIYTTAFNSPPNYASDPKKLVATYQLYKDTMSHWESVLDPQAVYTVQYENLIESPERVTRELLKFCELDFEDACLFPERNERLVSTASIWQVRQPIYRSSTGKWRQYEPWLGEFRQLLVE